MKLRMPRRTLRYTRPDGSRMSITVPVDFAARAERAFEGSGWTPDPSAMPWRIWYYLRPKLHRLALSLLVGTSFAVTALLLQGLGITHSLDDTAAIFVYTTVGCFVGTGIER